MAVGNVSSKNTGCVTSRALNGATNSNIKVMQRNSVNQYMNSCVRLTVYWFMYNHAMG